MSRRLVTSLTLAAVCAGLAVAQNNWDYNPGRSNGPAGWGALYGDCKKRSQSPINIAGITAVDTTLKPLSLNWPPLTSYNPILQGTVAKLLPLDYSGTIIDPQSNAVFGLADMHFHSGGEHGFGGSIRDLELHMVHSRKSGAAPYDYLVVGITFNAVSGGFNAELAPLFSDITKATSTGGRVNRNITLTNLVPPVASYYTYDGSLTLPPCTEGVKWYVMAEPLVVSQAMLKAMRDAMNVSAWNWTKDGVNEFVVPGNYRPTQPLNGRQVRYFTPTPPPPPPVAVDEVPHADMDTRLKHAQETATSAAAIGAIALVIAIGLVVRIVLQNVKPPKEQPYADQDKIASA